MSLQTSQPTAQTQNQSRDSEEVYKHNSNHPGAAHYVIHAYDDPENAIKALDSARRYAKIAPDVPHPLHMPSHIFLQLGMWSEAAASNEASWAAAAAQEKPKDRPASTSELEGYHSLHWLNYIRPLAKVIGRS